MCEFTEEDLSKELQTVVLKRFLEISEILRISNANTDSFLNSQRLTMECQFVIHTA